MSNYRPGTNYYEILEIDRDAPQNEIHKAYQRAKATYSQDNPALYSMFSKDEARELARMIEEAYSVLCNQAQRRAYDIQLVTTESENGRMPMGPALGASQDPAPTPYSTPVQVNIMTANAQAPAAAMSGARPAGHHQLPDFQPPNNHAAYANAQTVASAASNPQAPVVGSSQTAGAEGYTVRKSNVKSSVPAGQGRTPVGIYRVDEATEAEIGSRTDWDGLTLQKVRTYKNISVEQVSEATRISRSYLNALESNDFRQLPAPVFVRGFVVQVARMLGLDENKIAGSYMKNYKAKSGK